MAKKDEKGFIQYSSEELAQVPSFEQRQGEGGMPVPGTTLGAVAGGVLGSAAGPAGTVAGAIAGGAIGNQAEQGAQSKRGAQSGNTGGAQ